MVVSRGGAKFHCVGCNNTLPKEVTMTGPLLNIDVSIGSKKCK